MTAQTGALLLAACFTFGCAAIYEMRDWAQALTGILIRVALCLAPVVVIAALSHWPGPSAIRAAPSTAAATLPTDRWAVPTSRDTGGCRMISDRVRPGC